MIKFLNKALWASFLFSIPLYFISVFAFHRETQIEIILDTYKKTISKLKEK